MRWVLALVAAAVLVPAQDAGAIANGRAPNHPSPWAAYVRYEGETFICSGTLVAPGWVLTAAHCLAAGIYGGPARPAQLMKITVGTETPTDGSGETFSAVRAIMHPGYGILEDVRDVALVELAGTAKSQPLQVSSAGYEPFSEVGRIAISMGWGTDRDNGPVSDSLREADLRIVADAACGSTVDDPAVEMCTEQVVAGSGPCSGDSGGPLMASLPGRRFVLLGVLNTGSGEACGEQNVNGYADVRSAELRSWIAGYVPEAIAPPWVAPPAPVPPAAAAAAAPPAKSAPKRKVAKKTKKKRAAKHKRCTKRTRSRRCKRRR